MKSPLPSGVVMRRSRVPLLPELEQSEGYAGHDFVVEAGDTISLTTSSFNRLALVRANGKSPEEAQRRASEALAKLRCVVVFGSSEAAQ